MDKELKGPRRDLVKGMILAGAAMFLSGKGKDAEAQSTLSQNSQEEILYRETDEFKRYYDSLLD